MPIDHRHPIQTRRRSARAMVLASALSAAVLGASAEQAGAMASRGSGFSGTHVSGTTNRVSTYRPLARASKSNWTTSRRLGSRIVRLPPGGDDHPPRRPPHWPHRPPVVIGLPITPSVPTGIVNVSVSAPTGPSGPSGPAAAAAGGGTPPTVAAVNGNFVADEDLNIKQYAAQYFASRLINLDWVQHGRGVHQLYPAVSDLTDDAGNTVVTAYAVARPDGEWSLLLINKDATNEHAISIEFVGEKAARHFAGKVSVTKFGAEQYVWHPAGAASHADPDGPPAVAAVEAKLDTQFTLPRASITVLRGNLR